jgi:hypothetical protein
MRDLDVYRPLIPGPRRTAYYFANEENVIVFDADSRGCGQPFTRAKSEPLSRKGMESARNSSSVPPAVLWLDFECSGIRRICCHNE